MWHHTGHRLHNDGHAQAWGGHLQANMRKASRKFDPKRGREGGEHFRHQCTRGVFGVGLSACWRIFWASSLEIPSSSQVGAAPEYNERAAREAGPESEIRKLVSNKKICAKLN